MISAQAGLRRVVAEHGPGRNIILVVWDGCSASSRPAVFQSASLPYAGPGRFIEKLLRCTISSIEARPRDAAWQEGVGAPADGCSVVRAG